MRLIRLAVLGLALATPVGVWAQAAADLPGAIARARASVVAVGTFQRTRVPAFQFRGTGFAVADGLTIVTNAHVLPERLDAAASETIAIVIPAPDNKAQLRLVTAGPADPAHDVALLRMEGTPLPALRLRDSARVREGDMVLFTGFPIGTVLGPHPVTHRGMISAITPIAIPSAHSKGLTPQTIRRLAGGPFPVFQLDATAYPGNSGSPLYDPATGEVVGVVNMVFVKGSKEAALERPSGITYAIPGVHIDELLKGAR
jgi:S1-C subfamily serine protease